MQLKQIARVLVQFSPYTGTARSAREFLARVNSNAARASNPECLVQTQLRVKGEPFVEIEYDNKQVTRIDCAELTVAQILEQVQSRAEEMDTAQKLKAAGFGNQPIESAWQKHMGKEGPLVGLRQNVPRS